MKDLKLVPGNKIRDLLSSNQELRKIYNRKKNLSLGQIWKEQICLMFKIS